MKMKKKFLIIFTAFLIPFANLEAVEMDLKLSHSKSAKINVPETAFSLPVDVSKPKKRLYTLAVNLPRDFKAIDQSMLKSGDLPAIEFGRRADLTMMEFIPKKESVNNFSEIITLNKWAGSKIRAGAFTKEIIKGLKKKVKVSILKEEISGKKHPAKWSLVNLKDLNSAPKEVTHLNFPVVSYIVKYKLNGQQEILGMKYVSGPHDCSGLQYTIKLDGTISEESAVKKIEDFFNQDTSLIDVLVN